MSQSQNYSNQVPYDTTTDDYDTTTNDRQEDGNFYATLVQFFFYSIMSIVVAAAIGCLAFHLYKFFRSTSPQSLANKNLTLYCFLLLINNISNVMNFLPFPNVLLYFLNYDETARLFIETYFSLVTAFFKFIIALEICLCFRNIALFLLKPSGPQNTKFLICCVTGLGIPLIHTILIYSREDAYYYLFRSLAIIRVCRLFPVLGAFWYLRSASIDKSELWSKFGLHMRLLLLIGGISAVFSVVEIFTVEFLLTDDNRKVEVGVVSFWINNAGAIMEAILIGIIFTFKERTFRSING